MLKNRFLSALIFYITSCFILGFVVEVRGDEWVDTCYDVAVNDSVEYVTNNYAMLDGIFSTDAQASSASQNGYIGCTNRTWYSAAQCSSTYKNALGIGSPYGCYTVKCSVWNTNHYDTYYHLYIFDTGTPDTCVEWQVDDSDQDGLNDDCDPLPDDDYCFTYQKVLTKKENDVVYYTLYKVKDRSGNWNYHSVGDNDSEDGIAYVEINPITKTCASWATEICGGEYSVNDDSGGDIQINTNNTGIETLEGVNNNATSTVEMDYLADIVANSQAIADNQQSIADLLTAIQNGLADNTVAVLRSGGGGSSTVTVDGLDGLGADVAGEISADRDVEGQAGEDQADQEIAGWSDPSGSFDGDVAGDVPEKNLLSDVVSNFLSNNPVSAYLNGSGINTSGAVCSMTWNYKGKDVELTICNFADELQAWGVVLLGITGLISLMVVVKR